MTFKDSLIREIHSVDADLEALQPELEETFRRMQEATARHKELAKGQSALYGKRAKLHNTWMEYFPTEALPGG